jgi:hypothetical protein
MEQISSQLPISISIIDYIGKIENGVGLLLNLIIEDSSYELGFWYNKNGDVRIVPEPKLLKLFGVDNIYKYPKIKELVQLIYDNLPNPIAILDEFIKEK